MKSILNCVSTTTSNKISRDEEGKEIHFQQYIYQMVCDIVPIENCVFEKADKGKRCDFLFLFSKDKQNYKFLKNNKSLAYYVELKGTALSEACEQLLNSIENTKEQVTGFDINAIVVSSREFHPRFDNNEYLRSVYRLIKKSIEFKTTPHTIDL